MSRESVSGGAALDAALAKLDAAIVAKQGRSRGRVSRGARAYFLVLHASWLWRDEGAFFEAQVSLAQQLGVTPRQVRRWERELEEAGVVEVTRRGRSRVLRLPSHRTRASAIEGTRHRTPGARHRTPGAGTPDTQVSAYSRTSSTSSRARKGRTRSPDPLAVAFGRWFAERWEALGRGRFVWDGKERGSVRAAQAKARSSLPAEAADDEVLAEMQARAERMLTGPDRWLRENASPSMLSSRWNVLSPAGTGARPADPAGQVFA